MGWFNHQLDHLLRFFWFSQSRFFRRSERTRLAGGKGVIEIHGGHVMGMWGGGGVVGMNVSFNCLVINE